MPSLPDFEPGWVDRSARYFPLVGLLVGGVSASILLAAAELWDGPIPALLAVAAGIAVTGAFHEDGLADTADGLGGGQDRDRRLAIMKDSRLGTYGAAALGLVLALKVAAVASLAPADAALALVLAHGGGRAAAVWMMRLTPYVGERELSKWKPVPQGPRLGELGLASAFGVAPMLLAPLPSALGILLGALAVVVVARLACRLIGGHTGDVLGACEQVFETGFLLAAAAA